MANDSGQWLLSPTGSRAQEREMRDSWNNGMRDSWSNEAGMTDDIEDVFTSDWNDIDGILAVCQNEGKIFGTDLRPGELMNAKIPPAFDGRGSWFAFEQLVQHWEDSCILDETKRGPALRNRLCGEAAIYQDNTFLNRERLKEGDGKGVQYFLDTLRPEFVKGVQNIFLYRLFAFMRLRRGRSEITKWLPTYELFRKRHRYSKLRIF